MTVGLKEQACSLYQRLCNDLEFSEPKKKLISEHGWTDEDCSRAERQYRMFLSIMMTHQHFEIAPSEQIDEFWHAHILDTRKYFADTERIFGRYVHHYPYFGINGPEDHAALEKAFDLTSDLFLSCFDENLKAQGARCKGCKPGKCK